MITCLHTADVHVATFGALIDGATHVVRADFLDRARADGIDTVADEVRRALTELAQDGPVLCTCSTLGPLVDDLANPDIIRIDRPAMEQIAAGGGEVIVAICLQSTRDATMALFDLVSAGRCTAKLVLCDTAWPYFEAGDMAGYVETIAQTLKGQGTRVLLAQASMAAAADRLESMGFEVFTTPKAAADAVLARA